MNQKVRMECLEVEGRGIPADKGGGGSTDLNVAAVPDQLGAR